ncbi:cupin domain-containing protein [Planctomonas deserti]|uniref:cupin domain-containing protein n=1 Tax=Planctomonas deserti TaxID=2144185 RepID=UPI000D341F18|nr:cupin domain-containing protein [Planctomonas deserti]
MTIAIDSLRPAGGGAALFQGFEHGAQTSFFVVTSRPGGGAQKHRHPYEEIFVILDGEIEVIVDGQREMISGGSIRVIPPRAWHQFTNRSARPCLMVNIHSSPRLIQEDWADLVRDPEGGSAGDIS